MEGYPSFCNSGKPFGLIVSREPPMQGCHMRLAHLVENMGTCTPLMLFCRSIEGAVPLQVQAGFWRLLKLNGPEWPFLLSGLFASAVLGMQMPAFALAFSNILSAFYDTDVAVMNSQVRKWSRVFAGAGLGVFIMGIIQQ